MTTKSVQTILSKATQDQNFANDIQINPERALAKYNLTTEEFTSVKSGLRRLISKGVVIDNGSGM
jgi:hypothetical protein